MSDDKFDIVFRGDIVMGHTLPDVKQRLSQLFKIDLAKVDALFTGKAIPLKRNLDQASAEKYKAVLVKAGAQVSVKPAGGTSASTPPTKKADVRPAPTAASASVQKAEVKPAKALSLKERLELQAAEDAKKQAHEKARQEAKAKAEAANDTGGLSLAPVGSLLVQPKAPAQAPLLDITSLTLRPAQGDLLDANEKSQPAVVEVQAVDYDIAAVGSDLLSPSERAAEPEVVIDFSDFDIAEVGADLVKPEERIEVPTAKIANSDFELAPVGADLGEKKKPAPPPPPDTSQFSLDDRA